PQHDRAGGEVGRERLTQQTVETPQRRGHGDQPRRVSSAVLARRPFASGDDDRLTHGGPPKVWVDGYGRARVPSAPVLTNAMAPSNLPATDVRPVAPR
ncbi:hypothetical protein DMB36_20390, partial [Acinetobacter baumannii]